MRELTLGGSMYPIYLISLLDLIERLGEDLPFDQLKLQRLKKRKLVLKDEMAKLRSRILPDIIA